MSSGEILQGLCFCFYLTCFQNIWSIKEVKDFLAHWCIGRQITFAYWDWSLERPKRFFKSAARKHTVSLHDFAAVAVCPDLPSTTQSKNESLQWQIPHAWRFGDWAKTSIGSNSVWVIVKNPVSAKEWKSSPGVGHSIRGNAISASDWDVFRTLHSNSARFKDFRSSEPRNKRRMPLGRQKSDIASFVLTIGQPWHCPFASTYPAYRMFVYIPFLYTLIIGHSTIAYTHVLRS